MKIILAREDVVFKLPMPQITVSSRRPFLRFNFNFEQQKILIMTPLH